MTAAACAQQPGVAVERASQIPPSTATVNDPVAPTGEASLDDIGLDQDVLDSMDELGAGPADNRNEAPELEAEAGTEPALEAPEEVDDWADDVSDDRLQIDDVAWTVPDDNDRWDLDSDGYADVVYLSPWQLIDEALPPANELGPAWDPGARLTSITSGWIIGGIDTDCDELDILTGLNDEYHGVQSYEREGETISSLVIALDDSVQAAGLAEMLGNLSSTCPTIGADPQGTPFEPYRALPLSTDHVGLDGVTFEFPEGTSTSYAARSYGALLHVVRLNTWVELEPSELALSDFATIVDYVVEATPGAKPVVSAGSNPLTSALPTGDDIGLEWEEPLPYEHLFATGTSRSTCAARSAFGETEDRLEVVATTAFDADIYADVSVGTFDSASQAHEAMLEVSQLVDCPAPGEFEVSVLAHDITIDAGDHTVVPFTYDESTLVGATMDGAVLAVGPYVAVVIIAANTDRPRVDGSLIEPDILRQQLQLLIDQTVEGLEALS